MKFLFAIPFLLAAGFCEAQKLKKPIPDSTQIKNTITSFYNWYNGNWQKVNAFKLYKGKTREDNPPYKINWKEVERYFAYLRKNAPQLGEAFLQNEKRRFKENEKVFEKYPDEEIAAGFDYDRFTNSQEEPSWFWKQFKSPTAEWKFVPVDKTTSLVFISSGEEDWRACIIVKKEKNTWKIANTNCIDDEPPPQQKILNEAKN